MRAQGAGSGRLCALGAPVHGLHGLLGRRQARGRRGLPARGLQPARQLCLPAPQLGHGLGDRRRRRRLLGRRRERGRAGRGRGRRRPCTRRADIRRGGLGRRRALLEPRQAAAQLGHVQRAQRVHIGRQRLQRALPRGRAGLHAARGAARGGRRLGRRGRLRGCSPDRVPQCAGLRGRASGRRAGRAGRAARASGRQGRGLHPVLERVDAQRQAGGRAGDGGEARVQRARGRVRGRAAPLQAV